MTSATGWIVADGSASSNASVITGSPATDWATAIMRSWYASRSCCSCSHTAVTPVPTTVVSTMATCSNRSCTPSFIDRPTPQVCPTGVQTAAQVPVTNMTDSTKMTSTTLMSAAFLGRGHPPSVIRTSIVQPADGLGRSRRRIAISQRAAHVGRNHWTAAECSARHPRGRRHRRDARPRRLCADR